MNDEKLKDELKMLLREQEDIYKLAQNESRELSEPEFAEVDKILGRINTIRRLLTQSQQINVARNWADSPRDQAELPEPGGAYANVESNTFRNLGDFLRAVTHAAVQGSKIDRRLTRATGMSEGVPSDGGFLVQTDFASTLLDLAFKTGKLAAKCSNIKISNSANSVKVPGIDETSRVDGSRQGGVRVYFADEAALKTHSAPKIRMVELTLNKMVALCYMTEELIADAPALQSWIMDAFPREFGFAIDDCIINGAGGGRPLGILNSGALISVAAETGQLATTIIAENVEQMWRRMLPDSLPNAEWYINQNCWPQLFQLEHAVGTGGVPLFRPPSGLADAPFGTLLGRPINPIEQCASLGTVGDIIFADLGQYYFADKSGLQSAESMHVLFTYDEMCYRWVYRLDGQPKLASAITPYKGGATDTISPFVALATRS